MSKLNVILVNNTGVDIRMFDAILIDCVKTGAELPEVIADLFTLDVINVDGSLRGIVNMA